MVCQNQSIDDSDADLAHDLRVLLRQRLKAGDSDEQVRQYLVKRYGDYVLLKPPFKTATLILWTGPVLLLLAAVTLTLSFYRRSQAQATSPLPLSEEERRQLAVLLPDTGGEKRC